MQITIKALFDEETRKQIRDAILGEARGIARSALEGTIGTEIARLVTLMVNDTSGYKRTLNERVQTAVKDSVRDLVSSHWDGIRTTIEKAAETAVDAIVAQKLKDKTVWEAASQDTYIRKVVGEEIRKMLAPK